MVSNENINQNTNLEVLMEEEKWKSH
jgi:hypothetical protein